MGFTDIRGVKWSISERFRKCQEIQKDSGSLGGFQGFRRCFRVSKNVSRDVVRYRAFLGVSEGIRDVSRLVSRGFPGDFKGVPGVFRVILWDFQGEFQKFTWDFRGVPKVIQEVPGDFNVVSKSLREFRDI